MIHDDGGTAAVTTLVMLPLLTLILTLCYLPAQALLVVIPLFITLLAGLFG